MKGANLKKVEPLKMRAMRPISKTKNHTARGNRENSYSHQVCLTEPSQHQSGQGVLTTSDIRTASDFLEFAPVETEVVDLQKFTPNA
jgi:hypothetical protein